MGDLAVTVRLNDEVVDSRIVPVRGMVRVGEALGAGVAFPGANIAIVREGRRLWVRRQALDEGQSLSISLGQVEVVLTNAVRERMPAPWKKVFDSRFGLAAMLVIAVGTWADAADAWMAHQPERSAVSGLARAAEAVRMALPRQQAAAVGAPAGGQPAERPVPDIADGPRHRPDDRTTGTGYFAWYRAAVRPDSQVGVAHQRLADDPTHAASRRIVARDAYDRDDYELAAWHYRWIVNSASADHSARLRLAWAVMRLGHQQTEIELYRDILDDRPDDSQALAGLAVALARMGRLDEASLRLDELQAVAPVSPITELAVAKMAALAGDSDEAIDALDWAMGAREQLSLEGQIELRRDVAMDPAFAALRTDKRLLAVLSRHLGAAAPRAFRQQGGTGGH